MNLSLSRRFKRHRYLLLSILSMLLFACSASLTSPQVYAQTEQARSADTFVDSIGVNTHLRYIDTVYSKYADLIKPKLQELGVRHIRDGGNDSSFFRKLNELAALGIKSTLIMEPSFGQNIYPTNVVDVIKKALPSVEAVEGPNEWDIHPDFKYKEQAFPQGLRLYQDELYAAVKGDSTTTSLPVLMPSLAFATNATRLGSLASADLGNMHSYTGGNMPTYNLDTMVIPYIQQVTGVNKGIMATETGWHNATSDLKAPHPGVSELAAAKYASRLCLEYFNRGIQRAFFYELINQRQSSKQEQNFGLLRNNGSEKPAYTALKDLIALLQDPGPSFMPQTLNYRLEGSLKNIHHTLLQKRDGRFYLLLWQEAPSFNLITKVDQYVAPQSVTLFLDAPMRAANIYQPLQSIQPTSSYNQPQQIALRVPDHPLVVELTPA
jgi:hypothetical protein